MNGDDSVLNRIGERMHYLDGGLPARDVGAFSHSLLGLSQRVDPVFSSRRQRHTGYLCFHLRASEPYVQRNDSGSMLRADGVKQFQI